MTDKDIELLKRRLAVATRWLRHPQERAERLADGYYLDGDFAGKTLDDAIGEAARKELELERGGK